MIHIKTAVCAAAISVCAASGTSAAETVQVVMNGSPMSFDVPPVIINGRTMVPLRAVFEGLGASVDWDGDTETVISTLGNITVTLTIGENVMYINGEETALDAPACIINDRTLVPLRAVSEAYGAQVSWAAESRTAYVTPYLLTGGAEHGRGFSELRDRIIAAGEYGGGVYTFDASQGTISAALSYDIKNDMISFSAYTMGTSGAGILIFNDGTPLTAFAESNGYILYGIFEGAAGEFNVISNSFPIAYEDMENEINELIDAAMSLAEECFSDIGSMTTIADFGVYRNTTLL